MKVPQSRNGNQGWPRRVTIGRHTVTVYRRKTPAGKLAFMVANYAGGPRRLDSYADEGEALEAAAALAKQLSERQVLAANLTNADAAQFAAAVQTLGNHGVQLLPAVSALDRCLESGVGLADLPAACRLWLDHHRKVKPMPVAKVVAELLSVKAARGASDRYLSDLQGRLGRFAEDFQTEIGNVTSAMVQEWLDGLRLAPQSYANYRRVVGTLFRHAQTRGYCADSPVDRVEKAKVRDGEIEIFTPLEIRKLLAAAPPDFVPVLALQAFAGLRTAEVLKLSWQDIRLADRLIVVAATTAKTASRRIIPLSENLAAWLAPCVGTGRVWTGRPGAVFSRQKTAARLAGVRWKGNALRHSFGSYRAAMLADAGRVAAEMGNSAGIVHRHYRQLVTPAEAEKWFAIMPPDHKDVIQFAESAEGVR